MIDLRTPLYLLLIWLDYNMLFHSSKTVNSPSNLDFGLPNHFDANFKPTLIDSHRHIFNIRIREYSCIPSAHQTPTCYATTGKCDMTPNQTTSPQLHLILRVRYVLWSKGETTNFRFIVPFVVPFLSLSLFLFLPLLL